MNLLITQDWLMLGMFGMGALAGGLLGALFFFWFYDRAFQAADEDMLLHREIAAEKVEENKILRRTIWNQSAAVCALEDQIDGLNAYFERTDADDPADAWKNDTQG